MTVRVLGVDGAGGGWVGVVLVDGRFDALRVGRLEAVADGLTLDAIVIDMPLALRPGAWRAFDVLARARLGRHTSRLFPMPPREAIEAPSYAEALALTRAVDGRGLSKQAYLLRTAIAEARAFARARPGLVHEGHPELSFAAMAGAVIDARKKTWSGHRARLRALAKEGIAIDADEAGDAAPDDVLDAAAVAWTAHRVATGAASFLADPAELALDPLLRLAV